MIYDAKFNRPLHAVGPRYPSLVGYMSHSSPLYLGFRIQRNFPDLHKCRKILLAFIIGLAIMHWRGCYWYTSKGVIGDHIGLMHNVPPYLYRGTHERGGLVPGKI